ncbi:MAG TPA: hypothetical protein VFY45_00115 [Baekduia sp.]|nr:hypothetical protein [Baekduia sp.]
MSPFDGIEHRSWALTMLLIVVYLGSVTAIGSIIVNVVRGDDRWPRALSALAGFLPGYVTVLAPLQLLFAAVPLSTATWIALGGMPMVALLLHRGTLAAFAADVGRDRCARRNVVWTVVGVVVLVSVAVVHRLQVGEFYLTQDSIAWLLKAGDFQRQGLLGPYLGQWNIQSDEWVFNAPLMFSSSKLGDLWVPIYATQCVSLVSFLSLAFGIVHRLAVRRKNLAAGLAVLAIFGLTLAIYPWLYVTTVFGGQPVVTLGHAGRHVGILAPWIALLLLGRHPRSVMVALALATVGLGFTSVHTVLNVTAAVGAAMIWQALRARHVRFAWGRGLRVAAHLLTVVAIGAIVSASWWMGRKPTPTSAVWWLLAGAVAAVGGAIATGAVTRAREVPTSLRRVLAWGATWLMTMTAGLVLADNLTESLLHGRNRSLLAVVLPGYSRPMLTRSGVDDVLRDLSFPNICDKACVAYDLHDGIPSFLSAFGLLFVLTIVTWISFGRVTTDAAVNARRAALLIMVAALGIGFVIIFFTGASSQGQAIIMSRFWEVPSYGLLALAAMAFAESRSRLTAVTGCGVLVLWSVIPLIATQWPEQMVRNTGWYLQRLGVL